MEERRIQRVPPGEGAGREGPRGPPQRASLTVTATTMGEDEGRGEVG